MPVAKSKNTYSNIGEDLIWLREKADNIKQFVNANPYHEVVDRDRVVSRTYNPDGDIVDEKYTLVATIETIHKSLRDSLKELAQIMEMIDKLMEKEAAKVTARGNQEVSPRVQALLNKNA
jgi:hypothetical protein